MIFSLPLPSFLQTLAASTGAYCLYYAYWQFTTGSSRRALSAKYACQPIAKWACRDHFLSFDFVYETIVSFKNHTILDVTQKRHLRTNSNTLYARPFRGHVILTTEPEIVKTVLALEFKSWSIGKERIKNLEAFLGGGIFTSEGAAWQHSRDMLRPIFTRAQIGNAELYETHVEHLIAMIPRDGSEVDLQPLFFRLTMDTSTEFLFGESVGSLKAGLVETGKESEFAKAFGYCLNSMEAGGKLGALALFLPRWMDPRLERETKYVHDYVDSLIAKGLSSPLSLSSKPSLLPQRYILLHELAAQTTNKLQIRSELLNVLLAGRETTAALLSNVWYELAKRPTVYARLREEVIALGDQQLSFEVLKSMRYLRALLNESLRLTPVVPANARQALVDTVLPVGGGADGKAPVLVAKGAIVMWSLWAMHRRTDLYGEDAEEFRPERWLDEGEKKGLRVGWEYMPFNGGPRVCIGQQLALTEAGYVTVRLMQEYTAIESRNPEPWQEKLTAIVTHRGGCKVVLTPRD